MAGPRVSGASGCKKTLGERGSGMKRSLPLGAFGLMLALASMGAVTVTVAARARTATGPAAPGARKPVAGGGGDLAGGSGQACTRKVPIKGARAVHPDGSQSDAQSNDGQGRVWLMGDSGDDVRITMPPKGFKAVTA